MLRMAAFASSVVASTAMVLPLSNPAATGAAAPREDGAVALRSMTRRVRRRRMIRRQLVHRRPRKARTANESLARQAIHAFRVDPFKVANQQQPEVPTERRRNAAVPSLARKLGALLFDKPIEVGGVEQCNSAACRRDAQAIHWQLPRSPPTTMLAHSVGFPSPCNTL